MTTPNDTAVQAGEKEAAAPWEWVREKINGKEQYVVLKAGPKYVLAPNLTHDGSTFVMVSPEHAALIARAPSLRSDNERLRKALRKCEEYFDQRADADQPSGLSPIPNEEMTLLAEVRAALNAEAK